MLRDAQNFLLNDNEKIKARWKEYIEQLYHKGQLDQQLFQPASYDQEPLVLKEEVQGALKVLSNNKSPRIDGIPLEVLKQIGVITDVLTNLEDNIMAECLERSVFLPLLKKGIQQTVEIIVQ